ncbi:hypothetical protein G3I19_10605 [Streptomyces sp. SID10853]|uniref:hypothetical protein n=1 Tax=Streptomyces sp. SID10853 TaxID=2706028 RepID=UPI0013BFB04B|nr:hypothetical protein [Streptomyces sp. SID10853]NDZ78967.1 hypothetical protein [Streptomyces sp. SID10853]
MSPTSKWRRAAIPAASLAAALALAVAAAPAQAVPLPTGPGTGQVPRFTGHAAAPRPVPGSEIHNPFMAQDGRSAMHGDSYASNTQPQNGPLGHSPAVNSSSKVTDPKDPAQCATATFLRNGLMVLNCGGASHHPTLRLEDPATLEDLASYPLPVRPSTYRAAATHNPALMFSDTSGSYYYLDNQDRIVIAGADQHIQRLTVHRTRSGRWEFEQADSWDLRPYLPHVCATAADPDPQGECDPVTAVQADYHGLMWWASDHGRVGTVDPGTGAVRTTALPGEQIENSFSTGPDGAFIATDHALYKMHAAPDGTPRTDWRETYDRGTRTKPGQINQGTGATPALLGNGYVGITDNADPRMHVLVYKRGNHVKDSRLVCSVPVFRPGAGATENSLTAWGNGFSVENDYGYTSLQNTQGGRSTPGGITKIEVNKAGTGCRVAWTSPEQSPTVVTKLSRSNGLLYAYSKPSDSSGTDAWYLSAIDWRTGKTRFRTLTGTGDAYNNNWSPITLGPDGSAYISTYGGVVRVHDRAGR